MQVLHHRKDMSYRHNHLDRSKDIMENDFVEDHERETESENMIEDNPAFLKYLQLKVFYCVKMI